MTEDLDVLIVGAGISGIGAAYYLQRDCPERSYAIVEGRDAMGGTWDLFRYPGIRSDSDMHTLGYSFRPWKDEKAIADGPSILRYLQETAAEYGIDERIRFGHWVKAARWSSETARWTVTIATKDAGDVAIRCRWLFMCSGYYDYESGYTPDFPGVEDFAGRMVHPQKWTEDIDYQGKKVVVIGSGATAVTLVPALAASGAAKVTMLQRSPSYVLSTPAEDAIANGLRKVLPRGAAYQLTKWKNVMLSIALYNFCQKLPDRARAFLMKGVREGTGGAVDVETHFNPSYGPWDQRLCLIPDGDLFEALRGGQADVVTDHIARFTETGLVLESGDTLDADLVVTATGLKLKFLGGVALEVDGRRPDPSELYVYRGMMLSDIPNLSFAVGYTNASWTLKVDLSCAAVTRLLNHMAKHGHEVAVAAREEGLEDVPLLDLSSGYVRRALAELPKQGSVDPWHIHQNYLKDLLTLRYSKVEDGTMVFSRARGEEAPEAGVAPLRASV
ncbi:MAG: NAD(P)/FAD-dependent oxidoreductase [Myxococcota bacterium]